MTGADGRRRDEERDERLGHSAVSLFFFAAPPGPPSLFSARALFEEEKHIETHAKRQREHRAVRARRPAGLCVRLAPPLGGPRPTRHCGGSLRRRHGRTLAIWEAQLRLCDSSAILATV